jgi:hypothetical protein
MAGTSPAMTEIKDRHNFLPAIVTSGGINSRRKHPQHQDNEGLKL